MIGEAIKRVPAKKNIGAIEAVVKNRAPMRRAEIKAMMAARATEKPATK